MTEATSGGLSRSMFDLGGASAVVIGGGTTPGIETAVALVAAGAQVSLWEPPTGMLAADAVTAVEGCLSDLGINSAKSSVHALVVDPASDDSVSAGFEETCLHASIPGVLVNAMAPELYEAELFEIDMKKFCNTVEMSVLGGMLVPTRGFAAKWMQERMPGSVVTVLSSGRARSGGGAHASSAARGAIEALTRSTASELAEHDIRVNAVVGDVSRREGHDDLPGADHIAAAALYFCSAASHAGVSGSVLST